MTKESLDSDRVNYLIWRYLIETGYSETAVRLQKEWNFEHPQELPYHNYIKDYALVSTLNKGLLYHAAERDSDPKSRDPAVPACGVFGVLTHLKAPAPAPPPPTREDETENFRKRQIEDQELQNHQNGPSKRARLSNGYENGLEGAPAPKSPTAMDIDEPPQHSNGNAYPSPEQLPSPALVTVGPARGTQIDKVVDLTPTTNFVSLLGQSSGDSSSNSKNTVLLQCEFNPHDPALLAAAGTDALARIWTISPIAPDVDADGDVDPDVDAADVQMMDQSHEFISPPFDKILDDHGGVSKTTASLISWAPSGNLIAVASEPFEAEADARVEVWTTENSIAAFESFYPPVISILWNPDSTLLLALSPTQENTGTLIRVMNVLTQGSLEYRMPNHDLFNQSLEAAWTSSGDFVICGGDVLQAYTIADGAITLGRKYETREDHALSKVTFDLQSKLLATASDAGVIDIWNLEGDSHSYNAHQGCITALFWQPLVGPVVGDSERLLASAGEDGAISIWNARSLDTKYKHSMTMGSGVVGLAFTPDGAHIAGATSERVLIWSVEDVNLPRAAWTRGSEQGWQTPRSHDSTEEDTHSICWAADGQTLAYCVNNLLALIKFRP